MMNEIHWTWGMSKDRTQWYIKAEDLDTGRHAVAYYSSDDDDPLRWYESLDSNLLRTVIDAESTEIFIEAQNKKNMLLSIDQIENATIANFM